jgi:hypothetical protein
MLANLLVVAGDPVHREASMAAEIIEGRAEFGGHPIRIAQLQFHKDFLRKLERRTHYTS